MDGTEALFYVARQNLGVARVDDCEFREKVYVEAVEMLRHQRGMGTHVRGSRARPDPGRVVAHIKGDTHDCDRGSLDGRAGRDPEQSADG